MSDQIPFVRDMDFDYAKVQQVSPMLRRVVARNPSAFTFHGTGTYIIGRGKVAIVDAGPLLEEHIEAVLTAVRGEEVTHQLITHTHLDHSPAAAIVKERTGAKTYGFGPHGGSGVSQEGADIEFVPDVAIADGDVVDGDGWTVEALHTPGHTSNHLAFALREENALLSGDHIMGWSTTIVSPPDGDMGDYMASLDKVLAREEVRYWPTHGPEIVEPVPFVQAYKRHRLAREAQILACLQERPATIPEMVRLMYSDIPPALHPAAARSVLAHLQHMTREGRVECDGQADEAARYYL